MGYQYNLYSRDGNPRNLNYYINKGEIDVYVDDEGNYCIKTISNNEIILKMDRDMNLTIRVGDSSGGFNWWAMGLAGNFIEPLFDIDIWGGWEFRKQRIWIYPGRTYGYTFEDRFKHGARMFLIDSPVIRFDKDFKPLFGLTEITKEEWDAKMEKKKNAKQRLPKTSRW